MRYFTRFSLLLFLFMTSLVAFGQKDYAEVWNNIQDLEKEGKARDAYEIAEQLMQSFPDNSGNLNYAKASIYFAKYKLLLEEDSENDVLLLLKAKADQAMSPAKQVLSYFLCQSAYDYLESHYFDLRNRPAVDYEAENIKTWNIADFRQLTLEAYQNSLAESSLLKSTATNDFLDLIQQKTAQDKKNLFVLLVHEQMKFLQNARRLGRPDQKMAINQEKYFASSDAFTRIDLPETAFNDRKRLQLELYQQIETFYTDQEEPIKRLEWQLKRLDFVEDNYANPDKKQTLFLEALDQLEEKEVSNEAQSRILLKKAFALEQYADKAKHPDYLKDAIKLAEQSKSLSTDVQITQSAVKLIQKINKPDLRFQNHDQLYPQKPEKILIDFKNMAQVCLQFYRYPATENANKDPDHFRRKLMDSKPPDFVKQIDFPQSADHYKHTAEVLLPELPAGNYLLIGSEQSNVDPYEDKFYAAETIRVSRIALQKTNFKSQSVFQTLDLQSGMPLQDVKMIIDADERNLSWTDKNGIVKINRPDEQTHVTAVYKNDTLFKKYYHYNSGYRNRQRKKASYSAKILTDRGIYKPGQKVYFKSYLIKNEKDNSQMLANKELDISLFDPNRKRVKSQTLTTNAYGSLSGEFQIPKDRLLGNYSIQIETEEINNTSLYARSARIKVEKYKRPNFEVSLDDFAANPVLGDSIAVSGNVNAFFGGKISGANLKYEIKRSLNNYYKFSRYPEVKNATEIIKTGELKITDSGTFDFAFLAQPITSIPKKEKPVFYYEVSISVTDKKGETRETAGKLAVGYHTTQLLISAARTIDVNKDSEISLQGKDLNARPSKISGKLTLTQFQTPKGIYKNRHWPLPEIQKIEEDFYRENFPYQAYQKSELPSNFTLNKAKQVEFEVENVQEFSVDVGEFSDLSGGLYQLKFEGKGQNGFKLLQERQVELVNEQLPATYHTSFLNIDTKIQDDEKRKFSLILKNQLEKAFVNVMILSDTDFYQQAYYAVDKGERKIDFNLPDSLKNVVLKTRLVHGKRLENQSVNIGFSNRKYQLNIETDKLETQIRPDEPQQIHIKVTDSNGNPVKTEILASMYDESLDQFAPSNWSLNFKRSYSGIKYYPRFNTSFGGISRYSRRVNSPHYYYVNYPRTRAMRLYHFGYDFNRPNATNRYYLKTLQRLANIKNQDGEFKWASGFVVDQDGMPIRGVNVKLSSKMSKETQTDFDGYFSLSASPKDKLVFSYLGFRDKTIQANQIDGVIVLEQSSDRLEEVVTTAQQDPPPPPPAPEAIKVVNDEEVIIRGKSSLSSSNDPLYVVDGKIVSKSQLLQLEKSDMAEMKVLKGAEAKKLYGNRGRKGVVVITTKKHQLNRIFQQVKLRKDLKETAFFKPHIQTDERGKATIRYQAPQRLSSWKFRLAAHDQNANTAQFNKIIQTQKELNLSTNFPRFVRYGDTIQLSLSVTNLTDQLVQPKVSLRLKSNDKVVNEMIYEDDAMQNISIQPAVNEKVEWRVVIPKDLTNLTFEVAAQTDEFSDGISKSIAVLPDYQMITHYLSEWIPPNTDKTFNLDDYFKALTSNDRLELNYQINPAWDILKNLPFLVNYPYDCSEQTFARFFAYQVGSKILAQNPELATALKKQAKYQPKRFNKLKATSFGGEIDRQAQLEATISRLLVVDTVKKQSDKLLNKLEKMQMGNGGFPWFDGGRANLKISLHLLTGLSFLKGENLNISDPDQLIRIKKNLIRFLDRKFLDSADIDSRTLILDYLYARLSNDSEENLEAYAERQLDKMSNDWLGMSLHNKLTYAAVLRRMGKQNQEKKLRENLTQTTVINAELGKYWKDYSGFSYYSPILNQSIAIDVFAFSQEEISLLKQWLIGYNAGHSARSTVAQTYYINAVDKHTDQFDESAEAPIIKYNRQKIKVAQSDLAAGIIDQDLQVNNEDSDHQLQVKNKSKELQLLQIERSGEKPISEIPATSDDKLSLEKQIYKVKNVGDGQELIPIEEARLNVGDLIRVKLTINSQADMEFMALIDHRPAGFQAKEVLSGYRSSSRLWYYQTNKVTEMNFFFDNLPKGIHALTYDLKVTHEGSFQSGTATLEKMYAPKVKVNTRSELIKVED